MDNKKKTVIRVSVSPGAARNEVTGMHGDSFKIKIAAPPVKGKANKELISYLISCWREMRRIKKEASNLKFRGRI